MPTFERTPRFNKDWAALSRVERDRFSTAVREFVADLTTRRFHPGLRVKAVRAHPGVFEMTCAPDGRATWQYGDEATPGEPHVIWRRIGTHDILRLP